MPDLAADPQQRAGEDKYLADVEQYGLHIIRVHGDEEWSEFTYSVGLYRTFGLPEVIILGLRGDLAHGILNELARRAHAGERFRAGDMLHGLLKGFQVMFRPILPGHVKAHFRWASWYHEGSPFPTLRLLFPSTAGVWPWDPNASEIVRTQQPLLETAPLPDWARAAP